MTRWKTLGRQHEENCFHVIPRWPNQKKTSVNYLKNNENQDLSSDHSPVFLTQSGVCYTKINKPGECQQSYRPEKL